MFGVLWLGQIATVATTGAVPPDLVKAEISSNPVYALDLAFFLPLCAIAGVGLLHRNGAAAFAFPMLVWVPLMGGGVVGGIVLMAAAGDQTAVPVAFLITVLGVVSSILAAVAVVRQRAATGPGPFPPPVPHPRKADCHARNRPAFAQRWLGVGRLDLVLDPCGGLIRAGRGTCHKHARQTRRERPDELARWSTSADVTGPITPVA